MPTHNRYITPDLEYAHTVYKHLQSSFFICYHSHGLLYSFLYPLCLSFISLFSNTINNFINRISSLKVKFLNVWNLEKKDFATKWYQITFVHILFQILTLKPNADYNIHFPYKKGDLNIHSNVGGSLTAVLSYLEAIWGHCITTLLGVPIKDLKVSSSLCVGRNKWNI